MIVEKIFGMSTVAKKGGYVTYIFLIHIFEYCGPPYGNLTSEAIYNVDTTIFPIFQRTNKANKQTKN